jgi:uncharacterized protein
MSIPRPSLQTTALVTGASSGLGAALAVQLARRGHHLTLVARRAEPLEELATRIRDEHRTKVDVIPCDLADADARAAMLDDVVARERQVSVLVNAADVATGGDFVAIDTRREVVQVRVLVEAVVDITGALLPGMVERGSGAVLNVASTAGFQPMPWSAGYAAAKAHTLRFSEALHHELAGRGVAVTALCPGPVRSESDEDAERPAEKPATKAMPAPLWVDVDWVAEIALYGLDRNKRVVVPGAMVRLTALGSRFTPHGFQLPALRRALRPRELDAG